jgi:hypothetical protein
MRVPAWRPLLLTIAIGTALAHATPGCGGDSACLTLTCAGSCVDPDFDPNNCGACGNRCGSGRCYKGACEASVLLETRNYQVLPGALQCDLGSGSPKVLAAANDTTNAYVLLGCQEPPGAAPGSTAPPATGLYSFPLSGGGSPTRMDSTTGGRVLQAPLAVNSTDVVVSLPVVGPNSVGTDGIAKFSISSGMGTSVYNVSTPTANASAYLTLNAMVVDDQNVYFSVYQGGISSVALSGPPATATDIVDGTTYDVYAFAIDATNVYWVGDVPGTSANPTQGVFQVPKSGGTPVQLCAAVHPYNAWSPIGIAAAGGHVYWLDASPVSSGAPSGTLMRVPVGGGQAVAVSQDPVGAVYADGTGVCWTVVGTGSVPVNQVKCMDASGAPRRMGAAVTADAVASSSLTGSSAGLLFWGSVQSSSSTNGYDEVMFLPR